MGLPNNLTLFGVVLAGGNSSRMGTDKALLSIAGKTMLSRTQALLNAVGVKQVLVCRNEPGFVFDKLPNAGPVGGIYSVLEHLLPSTKRHNAKKKLRALVVVPIDMPFLDKQTLFELIGCGAQLHCSVRFTHQQFPLFLPINEEVRDCAQAVATSGNRSVKSFLNFIGCASITTAKQQPFINTNNPVQWQSALAQLTR